MMVNTFLMNDKFFFCNFTNCTRCTADHGSWFEGAGSSNILQVLTVSSTLLKQNWLWGLKLKWSIWKEIAMKTS